MTTHTITLSVANGLVTGTKPKDPILANDVLELSLGTDSGYIFSSLPAPGGYYCYPAVQPV